MLVLHHEGISYVPQQRCEATDVHEVHDVLIATDEDAAANGNDSCSKKSGRSCGKTKCGTLVGCVLVETCSRVRFE